jgi:quinol monooxygenase YgiN
MLIVIMKYIFCCVVTMLSLQTVAQDKIVRLAKLDIDSAQLDSYKAFLKEEIETSLKLEPGVLTLYAVFEKKHPTRLTILEIYADSAAYKSHIQTKHFLKYKNGTANMVKSLELVETVPLIPDMKIKDHQKIKARRSRNKDVT